MELQGSFSISDRVNELAENIFEMEQARINGESEVELSTVKFATPLAILPLAVYANHYGLTINCTEDPNSDACSYLDTIGFHGGVTNLPSNIKNYLPITKLYTFEGDNVLGAYEEEILSQGIQSSTYKDTIKFLTSELVANVKEHAKTNRYWILAQYYQSSHTNTCEIVIADNGIGYMRSYQGTEYEVKTDGEAIQNAFEGRSSKSARNKFDESELTERGEGIPTIGRIFIKGYGGKLIIMSGNSIMYYGRNKSKEIGLDYWLGSVVCINFNLKAMDIRPYL